jgi:hypothetical protein
MIAGGAASPLIHPWAVVGDRGEATVAGSLRDVETRYDVN